MTTDAERILVHSPVVAVLGAHHEEGKPAFYVPQYLLAQGYEIWPVNPTLRGRVLFGRATLATLAEIPVPVQVVDVFRRAEHIPDHIEDILAMEPRPNAVWFQLGIRNEEAAAALRAAGIEVIQDRCMLADHRRLGLGEPRR